MDIQTQTFVNIQLARLAKFTDTLNYCFECGTAVDKDCVDTLLKCIRHIAEDLQDVADEMEWN